MKYIFPKYEIKMVEANDIITTSPEGVTVTEKGITNNGKTVYEATNDMDSYLNGALGI